MECGKTSSATDSFTTSARKPETRSKPTSKIRTATATKLVALSKIPKRMTLLVYGSVNVAFFSFIFSFTKLIFPFHYCCIFADLHRFY